MDRPSISALAYLLVAATSDGDDEDTAETRGRCPRQTHESLREAASSGAERKARALFKHRRVIARWTAGAAKSGDLRRQHFKRAGGGNNGSSTTTEVVDRSDKEARLQNDHASPLLSLVSTERLGRHVVAAGAIPAGKLLLRESPFAWSLHPEFSAEFCAHCLHEVTGSTVSCARCGLVAYCSEACATAALRAWHGGECLDPSSDASLEAAMSGMSPACRVALRALRRMRKEEEEGHPSNCNSGDEELGREPSMCGTANDARASAAITCPDLYSSAASSPGSAGDASWPTVKLRHLQEHYTARSAQQRDLLETEAAIAAVLARCGDGGAGTHANGEGEGIRPAGPEADELLAAELVTTLVKVSTNAFAVSSLRCSGASVGGHVRPLTHAKVAVGIYLAAAMLNHSCTPNALASFHGGEMRVVATRAIEEGEPVTISYGPLSSKVSSTPERQAYLRRAYFFLCECEACRRPASTTITSPASRPGTDEDDNDRRATLGRGRGGAAAEATWRRTEFQCCKKAERDCCCCPGALLLAVPRAPSSSPSRLLPPQQDRCEGEDSAGRRNISIAELSVAPLLLSAGGGMKPELRCDRCGSTVPPDSAVALLAEDEEDRRLWDEAMLAVSHAEKEGEEGDRRSRSRPSSRSSSPSDRGEPISETSLALGLVVKRVEWREARLLPLSMRRAVAHDMHARILAGQGDFAGAADACARAVHVLAKRFFLEDQELGVEFLKLAELCFNAGWVDKCDAACRKARLSLEVCLRPGDEQLVALDTLQGLCAAAFSSGKG